MKRALYVMGQTLAVAVAVSVPAYTCLGGDAAPQRATGAAPALPAAQPKPLVQAADDAMSRQAAEDQQSASSRAFDAALGHFNKGEMALATGLFYRFLHVEAAPNKAPDAASSSVDIDAPQADDAAADDDTAAPLSQDEAAQLASNVAWAHFFLGESLAGLGLHHGASVYYYEVVRQAAEPELVPRALARLKDMGARRPVDSRLLYDNLIDSIAFANLPGKLADWMEFEQGRRDIKRGFDGWGDRHLRSINPNSCYAAYADYVRGVRHVRDNQDAAALGLFAGVAQSPYASRDVAHLGQLALARLRFDQGDYKGALEAYDDVRPVHLSFEEGQVLTEKAWTHYYLGHIPSALGALHALAAPSYEAYFYPDVYLLRAVIYKDRCHYLSAKDVVRAFRSKFARTFEQLRARAPQERIERIRKAAVMEGPLAERTRLLLNLTDERDRVASLLGASGGKLVAHVTSLYETAIDDNDMAWRHNFAKAADAVALRLLDTEEQINVLDYEVSLAIFRPVEDIEPKAIAAQVQSPQDAKLDPTVEVIYPFDGEYWNDELGDYQVMLPDRCLGDSP